MTLRVLRACGLEDLLEPARANEPLPRSALERVLASRNPLAAAALADERRRATSGDVVSFPTTLRVRGPGLVFHLEDATRVSHPVDATAGIEADEMQLVGALPSGASASLAVESARSALAARPDLPLRAFSASEVLDLARTEGLPPYAIVTRLAAAGVGTLDWRPGANGDRAASEVHRAAHGAGLRTVAPLDYTARTVGAPLLDRIEALRLVAEETRGFLSVVLLPDRSEGASPLEGTAGTQDVLVCALARLGLGHVVPHVTVDCHVLGHKLAALLLSAGADDLVGAQAALRWATPADDSPRPLNPDRLRRLVVEARRSPVRRDGRFVRGGA